MEWAIVAALLLFALKAEPFEDVVTGIVGWLALAAACFVLFWGFIIVIHNI